MMQNSHTDKNGFFIKVIRKLTGEAIFNTQNYNFIYSDRYLSIGTTLTSSHVYGLGVNRK